MKNPGMDAAVTLAHPVDSVDWMNRTSLLSRHGLLLPTEAQWEYCCRVTTSTPWFSGANVSDIRGFASVMDQRTKHFTRWDLTPVDWGNGFTIAAPVESLGFNLHGLHDVQGNVQEWCRDAVAQYSPASTELTDSVSGRADRLAVGSRAAAGIRAA